MPAYVIFSVASIEDHERLGEYKKLAHPTVIAAGGRVAIAYGKQESIEGTPLLGIVMIEFPTYDQASAWYHSDEYQEIAKIRKAATTLQATIVEGLPN